MRNYPTSLRAGLLAGLFIAVSAAAAARENPPLPDSSDPEGLAVIEVFGERAGPGLWTVRRGDNVLYILGTFSPLPKRMTWRSSQVEEVLNQATQVIPYRPEVDADVGLIKAVRLYRRWRKLRLNPDGKTLDDVLPPALFARFEAARRKYRLRDDDVLELRPLLAANEISEAAVESVGLRGGDDIAAAVYKMAKQRKVEVVKLRQRIDDPQAALGDLANINAVAEQNCLDATLARLDAEVATLREQVNAWAVGDVERLQSQFADAQRMSCWAALTSAPRINQITAEFDRNWFAAVARALEANKVTLAVSPIGRLLQKDGVLAQLAARGYVITPPRQ